MGWPLLVARASRAILFLGALLAGCGGGGTSGSGDSPLLTASAAAMSDAAVLGERLFHDATLSGSGRMSCATCHDAAAGHASPFEDAVALGGPNLDQPGTRVPPAIRYLRYDRAFAIEADGTPRGGFFWDGRAASLAEQARGPFLAANEMANASVEALVARVQSAPYAEDFRRVFGADVFQDPERAFDRIVFAIERYQREDPDFAPFTSKYDHFVAGRASLTATESLGLALFARPDKGNCAACHPHTKPADAPGALFTDFSYDALGVPRNAAIPANADAAHFDPGLCGRAELAARASLCGLFKVPSLRNVALRKRLFHNGRYRTIEEALAFYARRDTNPEEFYSRDGAGTVAKFDDLPPPARSNVNTTEPPYGRTPADPPALDATEIAALAAFLRTLTDGYRP